MSKLNYCNAAPITILSLIITTSVISQQQTTRGFPPFPPGSCCVVPADTQCEYLICNSFDSFCCEFEWDNFCIHYASQICLYTTTSEPTTQTPPPTITTTTTQITNSSVSPTKSTHYYSTESCPPTMVFKRCGTACPKTCGVPYQEYCSYICVAECQCEDPSLYYSPEDGICVDKQECPTTYQPTFTTTTQTQTPTIVPSPIPTPIPTKEPVTITTIMPTPMRFWWRPNVNPCCDCVRPSKFAGCPGKYGCEARICSRDRFCCVSKWDIVCALKSDAICKGIEAAKCCECTNHQHGRGCYADRECGMEICNVDPFCCNVRWDLRCVKAAVNICVQQSKLQQ